MSARQHGINMRTSLPRRRRSEDPMAAYDRLPAELRAWLAQAALPWSARSALRLWRRLLRESGGDAARAHAALSRIERARLGRDAARVWGDAHPAARQTPPPELPPAELAPAEISPARAA